MHLLRYKTAKADREYIDNLTTLCKLKEENLELITFALRKLQAPMGFADELYRTSKVGGPHGPFYTGQNCLVLVFFSCLKQYVGSAWCHWGKCKVSAG